MLGNNRVKKTKVHILGGDGVGWALDTDLNHLREALEGVVEFTSLSDCEVVHAVWWEQLLALPEQALAGKRVVCQASGEPLRYLELPAFRRVLPRVGCWIAQSSQAQEQFDALGYRCVTIPYCTDLSTFHKLPSEDPSVREMASRWGIPRDRFLVGNFHRDTEGCDLKSAKLVKGPDLFAEMMGELVRRGVPVYVVLAGPRRHWLRKRLAELAVPFTFVGSVTDQDDMGTNILSAWELNLLYNLVDLYVISSRSEGGPRSLLEAIAAGCQVASTRVGLAEDLLTSESLYSNVLEGCDLVQRLSTTPTGAPGPVCERLAKNHTVAASSERLAALYSTITDLPQYETASDAQSTAKTPEHAGTLAKVARLLLPLKKRFTVGVWHQFFAPPYGGGNQFMLALCKCLASFGIAISENRFSKRIDAYLLNSVHFDLDAFLAFAAKNPVRVVHRIDGPIHLIRGRDLDKDELCFDLNRRFASSTVIQSRWTLRKMLGMGYRPVQPVVINNGVAPDIFNRTGKCEFSRERKIRIVSSSWSDNPRKGGGVYAWLDKNLDFDRYEYSFIGRCSEKLINIRMVEPLPSRELAGELRRHDIYITASSNDPCSNAVIEALACGLPVIYLNDGGHPEIVGLGGLPFDSADEIPELLDKIGANYKMFQNLIAIPAMDEVAGKYLQLLREAANAP
ncbi:MAG: glycosyltransferase family 4 protein [Geobacter sp.]|nr:MAG: glycosyltransferase family 4 protein [Geobacter sp.]